MGARGEGGEMAHEIPLHDSGAVVGRVRRRVIDLVNLEAMVAASHHLHSELAIAVVAQAHVERRPSRLAAGCWRADAHARGGVVLPTDRASVHRMGALRRVGCTQPSLASLLAQAILLETRGSLAPLELAIERGRDHRLLHIALGPPFGNALAVERRARRRQPRIRARATL